jgi:hypothetical protein
MKIGPGALINELSILQADRFVDNDVLASDSLSR